MKDEKEKKGVLKRVKRFLTATVIGGFAVVLPIGLLVGVMQFVYRTLTRLLTPMRGLINIPAISDTWIIDAISLAIILLAFFFIGLIVETGIGRQIHRIIDTKVLNRLPFYSILRDSVRQFFGRKKMPFSQVVIADVMNTKMTGFVTDDSAEDMITVFVPTAPNPTNGFIFHLEKDRITYLDIRPEEAMRTIFGMGTGSSALFQHAGNSGEPSGDQYPV